MRVLKSDIRLSHVFRLTARFFQRHRVEVLAILLAGVLSVIMMSHVGLSTIHHPDVREKRAEFHRSILQNRPLGDHWVDQGGRGTNTRIAAVYLVEVAHRMFGVPIHIGYFVLDSSCIFLMFLICGIFLRKWASRFSIAISILYLASVLPLTFYYHYFHPWDRPTSVLWLLALIFVRENRFLPLVLVSAIHIVFKNDIIVIPAFYISVWFTKDTWKAVAFRAFVLATILLGIRTGLKIGFPGDIIAVLPGGEGTGFDIVTQVLYNIDVALQLNIRYPPFLMFLLPVVLGVCGQRDGDRFARASYWFSFVLLAVFFAKSNSVEVRAQVMVLFLLMPSAVVGLERVLRSASSPRTEARSVAGGLGTTEVREGCGSNHENGPIIHRQMSSGPEV